MGNCHNIEKNTSINYTIYIKNKHGKFFQL